MSVRDRSRYFCFEVDEALDYSGDDIIRAIQKRYPTTNYILVRGKNDWNGHAACRCDGGRVADAKQLRWSCIFGMTFAVFLKHYLHEEQLTIQEQ